MTERLPGVTIGVPIYRGERFLGETLRAIQRQSYRDFEVILSFDSPDADCEAICQEFLCDPRFRIHVHEKRRGWVGQINWLLTKANREYWYYNQQDDLPDERYLEILVAHARANPSAALVYCDIQPIGRISGKVFSAPSVTGATPYTRVMTMLQEHFPAFAFRGLARSRVIEQSGLVPENSVDNFGVDISWLTGVARAGELHRVPIPLYSKRYHDNNTESAWWKLPRKEQLRYWAHHCVDMLGQAIKVGGSPEQARTIWQGAVARLTAREAAGHFLRVDELTREDRVYLLATFLELVQSRHSGDLPLMLDATWSAILAFTWGSYWIPSLEPAEIVAWGPEDVVCSVPFNQQPDKTSALWLRTARYPPAGAAVKIGENVLATNIEGNLLTATVPPAVTAKPGELPMCLITPDGTRCSNTVCWRVHRDPTDKERRAAD
jgi:GT2 family glycosyltransferase